MKIALTRSSSTPLNPYGSRAETCQPQSFFLPHVKVMAMTPLRERRPKNKGLVVDRLPGFPKRPYKRKKKIFYSLLSIEEDGAGAQPP